MTTELELDVRNPSGLHARPAAVFVKAATGFMSDVRVANLTTGSREVPARSIIGILGLGVEPGHRIRVRIAGADEGAAAAAIRALVEAGLGEPITSPTAAPGKATASPDGASSSPDGSASSPGDTTTSPAGER